MTPIRKLFIANRAEIALRIVRTARRLGIATVVPFHAQDRHGPAVRAADDTVEFLGDPPVSAWLDHAAVVQAAGARCEAVERGVGPFRKLDAEALLGWQPDALVVNGDGGGMPTWIAQHPALPLLRCVARGRVLAVPGPLFNTTSHRLVEAAEFLQRGLVQWGTP